MIHPRRRRRGVAAALAVALPAFAAVPATASAASGATTIDLRGPAARSLRAHGVAITARKPARAGPRRIVLPVAKGSRARLVHRGAVVLRNRTARARGRAVKLTAWQTRVAPRRATVTARLGRRRVPIFVATYRPKARTLGDGTVTVTRSTTRLTRPGAKALRRALRLRRLRPGVVGRARVKARLGRTPAPVPPSPGGPVTPTPPPAPAPPVAQAPITGATVTWWVRDSFIRYIETGEGATPSGGAVAGAPVQGPAHACPDDPRDPGPLVYDFTFPLRSGWHDAATGAALLQARGALRFSYAEHGIDLTARDPEVQLVPGSARVVATFTGSGNTRVDARGALMDLDLATATRTVNGATVSYGPMRGRLAAGAGSLFGDFYRDGEPFGCFVVSYTTA